MLTHPITNVCENLIFMSMAYKHIIQIDKLRFNNLTLSVCSRCNFENYRMSA